MISILIIDDEQSWLDSFCRTLIMHKLAEADNIFSAHNWNEAKETISRTNIDLIFLDLIMDDDNGQDILVRIKSLNPEISVVIMTGVNDIRSAVQCIKIGASDYLIKNMTMDEFKANIKRAITMCQMNKENIALRNGMLSNIEIPDAFSGFITANQKIQSIFRYLTAISCSNQSVLITGESGVGKGILAKAIAKLCRPDSPFISVNLAGLDVQMFSVTLFGHTKGAYTGADQARTGAVQLAQNGTLFLDEIGDLPIENQIKLLEITQDGEYQKLGSDTIYKTNARFIFATNQNLEEKQKKGEFRKDLYYRLCTHRVVIPPLRERKEDIPLLLNNFAALAAEEMHRKTPVIIDKVYEIMSAFEFPGNVRQLRSMVYDAVAKSEDGILRAGDFHDLTDAELSEDDIPDITEDASGKLPTVDEVVNALIKKAMKLSGNNQKKAAAMIGLSQPTLSRKLKN